VLLFEVGRGMATAVSAAIDRRLGSDSGWRCRALEKVPSALPMGWRGAVCDGVEEMMGGVATGEGAVLEVTFEARPTAT
jgi:hypothetical protein